MSTVEKFRMQRRYRASMRKMMIMSLAAIITVFVIGLTCGSILSKASVPENPNLKKYYASVEIKPGDTLWTLADTYMHEDKYSSKHQYINEVMQINGLNPDDGIISGQYIILPYYAE